MSGPSGSTCSLRDAAFAELCRTMEAEMLPGTARGDRWRKCASGLAVASLFEVPSFVSLSFERASRADVIGCADISGASSARLRSTPRAFGVAPLALATVFLGELPWSVARRSARISACDGDIRRTPRELGPNRDIVGFMEAWPTGKGERRRTSLAGTVFRNCCNCSRRIAFSICSFPTDPRSGPSGPAAAPAGVGGADMPLPTPLPTPLPRQCTEVPLRVTAPQTRRESLGGFSLHGRPRLVE
mmetsp:Transcript_52548/g.151475  ORF Transcript_52548/g.151475 Transcript_52548/m.151475 type:complete len:244 (+) Transcript_52548:211-942(+)